MNTLYGFQHQALPRWAYNSTQFFNDLVNTGEKKTLYEAAKRVYENNNEECPFKEEDFGGFHVRMDVKTVAVVLRFPKPEEVPMCYCSFIFLDAETKRIGYYTLEKGKDPISERDMQFLCGWDKEGNHQQYGSVYTDQADFGDMFLLRFFYARFWNLNDTKIPEQPKEENENTRVLRCPACKKEIVFNASGIVDGDRLLVICGFCGRIYALKYLNDEFLIENKIQ